MMILNGSICYKWSMLVSLAVIVEVLPMIQGCSSSNNPSKFIQMLYLTQRNHTSRYKSNIYIIFNQIGNLNKETKQADETNPTERAVTLGKEKMSECI